MIAKSDNPLVVVLHHKSDHDWLVKLRTHLKIAEQYGLVEIWDSDDIEAGEGQIHRNGRPSGTGLGRHLPRLRGIPGVTAC